VERVEGGCPREGEEEGGGSQRGGKGGGGYNNWEKERGSARVGKEGGVPTIGSRSKARTRSPI
jgi:hypothetical protein